MDFQQGHRKRGVHTEARRMRLSERERSGKPFSTSDLLYRHALGEIARLIDIFAPQHRDVIGQQLQRDREENRRQ